jgi:alpha-mannosidase
VALTIEQRAQRLRVRLEELVWWRYRETRALDGWRVDGEPAEAGTPWPSGKRLVRLEHPRAELPAGWDLERARLHLDVGYDAHFRIDYRDAEPEAFGVDANHYELPLRARDFSVDATAIIRRDRGRDPRGPRLGAGELVLMEPAVDRLHRQLELIAETVDQLPGHDVRPLLLTAAEEALGRLEWPSATDAYLRRMSPRAQIRGLWSPPEFDDAPLTPMTDSELRSVELAADGLREELERLRGRFPKEGRLAVVGHAHIDLAWLWPLEETRRKGLRTFSSAVSLLSRNPGFRFNQSTAQLYAFVEEDDPNLFTQIREQVAAGRWEPIGGSWVESDTNMPTGESLVRQHLYGQRYFERTFGHRHHVAWLPDCFGFSPSLPGILRGAGLDSFFTIKTNWSETNRFPMDLFWWQGIDGSRVLTHIINNPSSSRRPGLSGYNGDVRPSNLKGTWANFKQKTLYDESLLPVGAGDGGGGPFPEMIADVTELEAFPVLPEVRYAKVADFYERAAAATDAGELPVWIGEMYLELHRGTLTTQGRTKRLNRRAERALIGAEVLGSLTALFCQGRPESLEPIWQVLLRNQFHDILPGSSIRQVYERTEAELSDTIAQADAVAERHLDRLAERVAAGDQRGLVMVNTELSPRPVRAVLREPFPGAQQVEEGWVLSGRDEIPGLSLVTVEGVEAPAGLEVSERTLENALLRVELDDRGRVTSLFDKRAGREALEGPARLWAYVDKPRSWDAWDIEAGYEGQGEEIDDLRSLEVIERGPHRAAIRVVRHFRSSTITQELRLWANSPRLDFRTTFDWHDRRWLVKARFPLAVRSADVTYECAFGVARRPTTRNTSWDEARFEVAGHRFADLSEPGFGVALLNDGRYGHHAHESELGLSLLRSPIYPDPYADEGVQTVTYALCPHTGDWLSGGILTEAEDLNQALRVRTARVTPGISRQAVTLKGTGVALGALKVAEDSEDLILRLYEPQGARGSVDISLPEGWELGGERNLLEDEVGEASTEFSPFQARTWSLVRKGS